MPLAASACFAKEARPKIIVYTREFSNDEWKRNFGNELKNMTVYHYENTPPVSETMYFERGEYTASEIKAKFERYCSPAFVFTTTINSLLSKFTKGEIPCMAIRWNETIFVMYTMADDFFSDATAQNYAPSARSSSHKKKHSGESITIANFSFPIANFFANDYPSNAVDDFYYGGKDDPIKANGFQFSLKELYVFPNNFAVLAGLDIGNSKSKDFFYSTNEYGQVHRMDAKAIAFDASVGFGGAVVNTRHFMLALLAKAGFGIRKFEPTGGYYTNYDVKSRFITFEAGAEILGIVKIANHFGVYVGVDGLFCAGKEKNEWENKWEDFWDKDVSTKIKGFLVRPQVGIALRF